MMDDAQRKLLDETGTIILPDEINHEAFELVAEACLRCPDRELKLICRGDGGDARAALAIVDVIRAHGKVTGLLPGTAISSHAVIFASCFNRKVYSGGSIGIHEVARGEVYNIDSRHARLLHADFERINLSNAIILATACAEPLYCLSTWWLNQINETGSRGILTIDADDLISKYRMAVAMRVA